MKIVLLGAGGMLGTALQQAAERKDWCSVVPWGRRDLDLTAFGSTQRFKPLRDLAPDVVLNCAAYTAVDAAEDDPVAAMDVNAQGPSALAGVCRETGARLVQISTDYVFDGTKGGPWTEDDPANPQSVYGRSKWEGEEGVRKRLPDALIVRTAWVYGPNGRNFVDTILAKAQQGGPLKVVNDQRGSPTFTRDLAEALFLLVRKGATGTLHVANAGSCTWFEFAVAVLEEAHGLGLLPSVPAIVPCATAEFPRPAKRPANSVLDTSRFATLAGVGLRPWRKALKAYLTEKVPAPPA